MKDFINQADKGQGNVGTYVLTIAIAFLSLVVGQLIVESVAIKVLGYSLVNIPSTVDLNLALSLLLIPFSFVLVALMLCVKYLHKRSILSLFTTREKFDWKRFSLSFFVWGGIMGLFLVSAFYLGYPIELNFNAATFFPLLLVSLFLLPLQTTAEEVLFRGYLFQAFGKAFNRGWISILLTGTLFGLLHWANPEVAKIGDVLLLFYIGTGVFLGILTHMDDGLELGMGYHAINNIFAALILTNNWQAFQTDAIFIDNSPPTFGVESFLTLLVLQPLLLFTYSRIYKWKNWKEKLLK